MRYRDIRILGDILHELEMKYQGMLADGLAPADIPEQILVLRRVIGLNPVIEAPSKFVRRLTITRKQCEDIAAWMTENIEAIAEGNETSAIVINDIARSLRDRALPGVTATPNEDKR